MTLQPDADLPGLDPAALEPWLVTNVGGAAAPFTYELIAAGGSNLTYRMTDADGAVSILRRPPAGRSLQSAHDMSREWTIMSALDANSDVPVPACLAHCTDTALIGAGFYVMEFVDGLILRTAADGATLTDQQADHATDSLIATQVAFHTLELAAVGLADLGRHDSYTERQLRRWKRQVDTAAVRELPLLDQLHATLAASIPPERVAPALAHGDYRFDNTVLAADATIAAVLDWELCTTGDPIADFAWSIRYWADPGDEFTWLSDPPTLAPQFPSRAEATDRYERASGFDLSDLGWYEVFSWWKQACIVEGVYARRLAGARAGAPTTSVEAIAVRVDTMLTIAHDLAKEHTLL